MKTYPVALALTVAVLAAPLCRAQAPVPSPAFSSEAAPPVVHTVPPGPAANTLALTVANTSARSLSGVRAVVREAPAWVRLGAGTEALALAGGEEAVVSLAFSLADGVAADQEGALVFDILSADGVLASKRVHVRVGVPEAFDLEAAYPNPFAQEAMLPLSLPVAAEVRAAAYDVLGREVAVLADGELEAGRHLLRLSGAGLASGLYVVRVHVQQPGAARVFRQKLTLLR